MRRRDERGSIAPAIPIIAFMLLLLGGLGIDASRQLNARGEAVAFAEEAARAGAQAVDVDVDDLELDEGQARQRVADYCAALESEGRVRSCQWRGLTEVGGDDHRHLVVNTRVELSINATLLGMIGVRELHASADAKARPYEGITDPFGKNNGVSASQAPSG
ncbi:pilus assembly protein TadG-related protein [Nocardioides sp. CER19]|uniref:pilus assembly protein TadG-related protein n=1 Tax=Nocardioides sp. CER19 TaxID=3038538 RepID=UPI0024492DF1|nr:pilus assembly protein TadG-related protein [Nocardioides sp. CER19]MDH2413239.1 pilus assembly protein TadG-related protein [Nocardioides sp. CER19]